MAAELDLMQLVVVCGLNSEVVSQHDVHRPVVVLLQLAAPSQRGSGRQQQDILAHRQLLLPSIQHPLRHFVRFPAPLPLEQPALLASDPGANDSRACLEAAGSLSDAVTHRRQDDRQIIDGQGRGLRLGEEERKLSASPLIIHAESTAQSELNGVSTLF